MLEHEFYPTTNQVVLKMLAPYWEGRKYNTRNYGYKHRYWQESKWLLPAKPWLEPHGGNGAILDVLAASETKEYGNVAQARKELFTIELSLELRFVLQEKGYRVIGSDFLTYNELREFGSNNRIASKFFLWIASYANNLL